MPGLRIAMLLHKSVVHDSRVRREARTLADAGHEVVVLELAPVPSGERRLDGFQRRSVTPPPWLRRLLPFQFYRLVCLLRFASAVCQVRPKVIHAHDAAMLLPAAVGRRLTGAPVIYDSHEFATSVPYRDRRWAWFVRTIEAAVVPRCLAIITVSDGIAERLARQYGLRGRVVVVRNVSDLRPGGEGGIRKSLGLPPEAQLILHQGAPAPGRGCEVLVEAMSDVPGAHLVFMGDPEPGFGELLEARIVEHRLGERVHVLPSVPLDRLLGMTAEANVGVSLLQNTCENHRLALPNKLFEYVAASVPIVSSDLPEMASLVCGHGLGWTTDSADPCAVAATLRTALDGAHDETLRRRVRAAGRQLTWSVESRRLTELYAAVARHVLPPRA